MQKHSQKYWSNLKTEDLAEIFYLLSDLNRIGICLVRNSDRKIIYFNRKIQTLFFSQGDISLLEKKITDFIPLNFDQGEVFNEELLEIEGNYSELWWRRDEEYFFISNTTVSEVKLQNDKYNFLCIEDTSLQKKMQREVESKQQGLIEALNELTVKNEELMQMDEAKDKFLALVAHELRTPLSGIVSSSEILYHKYYDTEEEQKEFTHHLYSQSQHMMNLVNDVLDLTKIQSGKMDFYIEEIAPFEVFDQQRTNFVDMAEKTKIKIEIEKPAEEMTCLADKVRLAQIVGNLISNAIKYNKEGGAVKMYFKQEVDYLHFFIQDTGIGIPEDKIALVFNEFETLGKISQHHQGTGLGLPIVKKIVEAMGGKLNLTSQHHVGTTVQVSIPKTKILAEDQYRPRPEF